MCFMGKYMEYLVNVLCTLEKMCIVLLVAKCQLHPFGSWCSVLLCLDFLFACSIDYCVRSGEVSKETWISLFFCIVLSIFAS